MRLFVADDSELLRSHLIDMLSEIEEIEIVGQAGNAGEAIASIRDLSPDVVILDIRMPDGNGIDVLESMRKENISSKVIIFTNYPHIQYRKKCMDAGVDFFSTKPQTLKSFWGP